jgi:hypothetical protein
VAILSPPNRDQKETRKKFCFGFTDKKEEEKKDWSGIK